MTRTEIKALISERGTTIDALAEKIGVSPQAVSEIVAGRTRGATARYSVAAALGVTVADLWPPDAEADAA